MSVLLERVISLISSDPRDRRDGDIDVVITWLRKQSQLLRTTSKGMSPDVLRGLVRNCQYERAYKDDVIILQGEKGDKFYVMLSGRASLYIDAIKSGEAPQVPSTPAPPSGNKQQPTAPSDDDTAELEAPRVDNTKNSEEKAVDATAALLKKILEEEAEEAESLRVKKKKQLDRSQFGRFIMNYEEGKSFGEFALLNEDAVRNASILADDVTDLLVIDRQLFNETFKAKQEEEFRERKQFVDSHPLFRNWSMRFRRLLEMSLRKEILPYETVLIKQGEPVIGLHFILSGGEAKVMVEPGQHKQQFPRWFDQSNSLLVKEFGKQFAKKNNKAEHRSLVNEQVRVRRREGYAAAERRLVSRELTLCFVDENEVIGDTEFALGLENYCQSVICTANTEVFILDNKNIDRLIPKKHQTTVDLIRDRVEAKLHTRVTGKLAREVPLFNHLLDKVIEMRPRRGGQTKDKPEDKAGIVRDIEDEDLMMGQMVKLFLQDKGPLLKPSVPGTLYYKTRSLEKARRRMMAKVRERKDGTASEGNVRLDRARRSATRRPRSRRELEKLTKAATPAEDNEPQEKNHAIRRFLSQQHASSRIRPQTALSAFAGRLLDDEQSHDHDDAMFSHDNDGLDDIPEQTHLSAKQVESGPVQHIVLKMSDRQHDKNSSRTRIICSLMDRKQSRQPAKNKLGRPKSAPVDPTFLTTMDDDDDYYHSYHGNRVEEAFDEETSNNVLGDLERRLQDFHSRMDKENHKHHGTQVTELRRFNIQTPEDVPIPGGTVYVRQSGCRYPGGTYVNPAHHQHVRRFIIPKDAYTIATQTLMTSPSATTKSVTSSKRSAKNSNRLTRRPSSGHVSLTSANGVVACT